LKVSLVDRARARARYVSFCSNHDSGTALPPPSGRDLRRRGPVTWPFARPRPAPSRRLRAAAHGNVTARRRARARARTRRVDGSSVRARAHLPPCRSQGVLRSPARARLRPSGSGQPSRASAAVCSASGPVRPPSEHFSGPRVHRARLRYEVPGFGAVPMLVPLASQNRRAALAADRRSVSKPAAGGETAIALGACSRPSGGSPSRLRLSVRS